MKVCIAEKPSVASSIAGILGARTRKDGYFEGNGYQVTWTFGHLCELKAPEDYHEEWKHWKLDTLPMIPEKCGIRLIDNAGIKKQFKIIKKLFDNAEEIINCGDAGQEGELIQRWVMQHAKAKCRVRRLWISSLTDEAIREGFRRLHDSHEYDNLYLAGLARAVGDWMLGMNLTRLYTLWYGGGEVLTVGRVQTATLAMLVERHKETSSFIPKDYWVLTTQYRGVTFTLENGSFDVKEQGQQQLDLIKRNPISISDIEEKQQRESPPQLYDLTALQVDCNRLYGMSAADTLATIQSLYEKKYTTYPRVDTRYLSDDIYTKCPAIIEKLTGFEQQTRPLKGITLPKSKRVFDTEKVTDHHAIIPTGQISGTLSDKESRVYRLIVIRFLSVFYEDCLLLTTSVNAAIGSFKLKATGRRILRQGWKELYRGMEDQTKEDGNILSTFQKGETGSHQPELKAKKTVPPKPFTEASLLKAMEGAGKQVDDEELRELMKENGIGRPSSRAEIIEKLLRKDYVVRNRKTLEATDKAITLIKRLKRSKSARFLTSPELTGLWEKHLRQIEKGQYSPILFYDELKRQVMAVTQEVKSDSQGRVDENSSKRTTSKKKYCRKRTK